MFLLYILLWSTVAIIAIFALIDSFFSVEQQSIGIVERFGKFVRLAHPGLNFKLPLIETWDDVSLRVQQIDVDVETKTQDNVFVSLRVSVQYKVVESSVFEAYYKLENAEKQIKSYVFDAVRTQVPRMALDSVFEEKDSIASTVKDDLLVIMSDFGYTIVKALVTETEVDAGVKAAMNEINQATRERMAANERGEAEKILKIKQAEAEAQSNKLQGQGIADQRKAIIDGLKESIAEFQRALGNEKTVDVLNIVMLTQYYDTLKEVSTNSANNTIMVPHSPSAFSDISAQIRDSIVVANQVK